MLSFPKCFGRLGGRALLVLGLLALTACGTEQPQTIFSTQGNSSREIFSLWNIFFYIAVGVFVVVEGLLVYSIFRYRRRPEDGIPLQIHGNQPIEIAWTIIPAIIVLFLATMTFRTQSILVAAPQDPVRVTVVGHQWWWEFEYPDLGVVTANEVHLPADRDIEFTLESDDVIHSFWIPRLSGKTDVVPGHRNRLTFRADNTTEPIFLRGQCAEYCGGTHAQMGMFAVVEPQAAFDAWVSQQRADARTPADVTVESTATAGVEATPESAATATTEVEAQTTGTPETDATTATTAPVAAQPTSLEGRGYQLFQERACTGCHMIQGRPDALGNVGPDLTHVGSRQHIVAGWLENTPDNMRSWLRDPNAIKPGNIMGTAIKRGTLSEDDIEALTAYMESLE